MIKSKLLIFIIFIMFLTMIMPVKAQDENATSQPDNAEYATGRVLNILSQQQNKLLQQSFGGTQTTQLVKVKILDGKYKGKIVEIKNQLTSSPVYDINAKKGGRVILDIEKNEKLSDINISDLDRLPALMIISGLFFSLLLIIGGKKGIKALFSLLFTACLMFFAFVPAVLNNLPIIPVTIAISILATVMMTFIVSGINLKSVSAIIGSVSSLSVAGIIAMIIIKIAPLTGYTSQEAIMLYSSRPDLNFTGILAAGMIIGALGAVIDIGISIASSISEIKCVNNNLSPMELTKSGLNVGKDIMGAMANTLILAYIGGSLPLILLASNVNIVKFINLNAISAEITAALAGSIGIILCVPITAVVSGYLLGSKKSINQANQDIQQICHPEEA